MAGEEISRFRSLSGPYLMAEKILAAVIPLVGIFFILDVPMYLFSVSLFSQQYLGLFLGLVLALAFLLLPASRNSSQDVLPWHDVLFAILSIVVGLYVLIFYPKLILTIGLVSKDNVIFGVIILILVLEATRRIAGWMLTLIVLAFIMYGRFGYLMPGALAVSEISWGRLITQLFLGAESLYGIALRTSALVVFAFVIFAHGLFSSGGADFLFKIAESLMGRYRGGPAKVSILASSFFGMMSGSAVANVAGTGTITIPLMKRTGYPAHFASAVEAVASTGGTITPPVMGAAAFIIAEFLGVSYSRVVLVSIMPAVLYYLSLFVQVDLRAAKENLRGLPDAKLPPVKELLAEGWVYLLPLAVLVYSLFVLYLRPEAAALFSLATLLVLVLIKQRVRGLRAFLNILGNTSRGMLEITVICGAAGLVIGIVNYTGLGLSLSRVLTDLAGGNLLLLALMTAVVSIILGMGIPVTASYLLLAVLAAPALIKLGVPPLVAHIFIFYFGTFSFITPPVCLAAYTAASIGNANLNKTAIQAMKLASAGYIVPFIFIFDPAVVFMGEPAQVVIAIVSAAIAVFALSFALENFFLRKLGLLKQALYFASAIALFVPSHLWVNILGVLVIAGLMLWDILAVRRSGADRMAEGSLGSTGTDY